VCPFTRVVAAATQSTRPVSPMTRNPSGIPTSPASSVATRDPPIVVATRDPIAVNTIHSTIPKTSTLGEIPMQEAFTGTGRPGRTMCQFGPQSECRRSKDRFTEDPVGNPAIACHPRISGGVGIAKREGIRWIITRV